MPTTLNARVTRNCIRAAHLDYTLADVRHVAESHKSLSGFHQVKIVLWFLPVFSIPYGGIHTIFRIARRWRQTAAVKNVFIFCSRNEVAFNSVEESVRSLYPGCHPDEIKLWNGRGNLEVPFADVSIATFWETVFFAIRCKNVRRYFYLVQDYEPSFYPAGTNSALAESTYRLGFYGIANTRGPHRAYEQECGGVATYFDPCVDRDIFSPLSRPIGGGSAPPWRIFVYGRPGVPRNAFALCIESLRALKEALGKSVNIVSAGAIWDPAAYNLTGVIANLGVLTVEETAMLYRGCDLGLCLIFTRHCSYLPLELMACGCPVVTNANYWTEWLLRDEQTCFLAIPTKSCIKNRIEDALGSPTLRQQVATRALGMVDARYSNWNAAIDNIFSFVCDPTTRQGVS